MVIGSVVLAAGQSKRMGVPKLTLPWGDQTIIAKVVSTLMEAGVSEIIVVTGASREAVTRSISGFNVNVTFNPDFQNDDMLTSLKIGMDQLSDQVEAMMVVLGDQPQVEPGTIQQIILTHRQNPGKIIIPSYRKRRGHPWLIDRKFWTAIRELQEDKTLRNFLNQHQEFLEYLVVNDPSILKDIDTPEDYQNEKN